MNPSSLAAIAILALIVALGVRHLIMKRFAPKTSAVAPPSPKRTSEQRKASLTQAFRKAGELVQSEDGQESKTRLELMRAGLHIDALTWRGIQASAFLASVLIGSCILALARFEPATTIICFTLCLFLGYSTPKLYLSSRKRERTAKLRAALPSTLELLNTAMRAGYSIERGIRLVSTSTHGPLSQEFRRVDQEVNLLGMPLDKALLRLKTRCDTPSISSFVNAMVQAHQQGTSMARALDSQARAARSQHYADMLVRINQLPNKMVPVIFVFFFPVIITLAVAPVIYNAATLLVGIM